MNKPDKRAYSWMIFALIGLISVTLIAVILFFLPESDQGSTITLHNPVAGKTIEQAVAEFNETFVLYLLYTIEANKLTNPPFSDDTPKIEIHVDNIIYNAEVTNRVISVKQNSIPEKDIIIYTTGEEAVKMLQNRDYIKQSFDNRASSVELIASKARLFLKGYNKIYDNFS